MAEGVNLEVLQAVLTLPPGHEQTLDTLPEPIGSTLFQISDAPVNSLNASSVGHMDRLEQAQLRSPGLSPSNAPDETLLARRLTGYAPDRPITEAIGNRKAWPFSAIGRLTASFNGRLRYCTGSVVSERVVLTAAHCVYARQSGTGAGAQFADWIRFEPQLKHDEALGAWAGTVTYIHQGWSNPQAGTNAGQYDYAFVRLDRNIAAMTGTISILAKSEMQGPITSLGYPRQPNDYYNFSGEFLYATTGAQLGQSSPGVMEAANELPVGSSGGPWLTGEAGGVSMAGLNSTKPIDAEDSTFSPMFSEGFLALFARVLADQAGV